MTPEALTAQRLHALEHANTIRSERARYETPEEVGFRDDPIPHYNRGRTRLEARRS